MLYSIWIPSCPCQPSSMRVTQGRSVSVYKRSRLDLIPCCHPIIPEMTSSACRCSSREVFCSNDSNGPVHLELVSFFCEVILSHVQTSSHHSSFLLGSVNKRGCHINPNECCIFQLSTHEQKTHTHTHIYLFVTSQQSIHLNIMGLTTSGSSALCPQCYQFWLTMSTEAS